MNIPTNADRAERAYRTILTYQQRNDAGEDFDAVTVDFLADLMHEVRMHQGDDFDELIERARAHHDAEASEEREVTA